jgi:sRNA-binding protein
MSFTQTIQNEGFDFSTMPRGFKEELAYIEALTKKIEASEAELDENSDEEEKQTIANAKESLEERKAEFLEDLKELRESQKAKEESAARPKKAAPVKKQSNGAETEVAIPEPESEKKEGSGIAGYVIGGIALLVTFGAINYFKRR